MLISGVNCRKSGQSCDIFKDYFVRKRLKHYNLKFNGNYIMAGGKGPEPVVLPLTIFALSGII